MKVRAYAKINLALDVVRRREDGYHELDMIMTPIGLHDLILIDIIDQGIELTANTYRIPTDERNIMYKVADRLIKEFNIQKGVRMHIYKHIPSQAGLGGGSADGAAVLKAMNVLFDLNLSLEEMASIGKEIGADLPFCLYNRMAIVEGIGEKIELLDSNFESLLLLVKPKKGVSTQRSFQALDIALADHPDIQAMKKGILSNDYDKVINHLGNSLEKPSFKMVNDIEIIKNDLLNLGFDGALMSGSGSCVFGMTRDPEILNNGYLYFRESYPFVRKSYIKH